MLSGLYEAILLLLNLDYDISFLKLSLLVITAVLLMHAYLVHTDLWTRNILTTINNSKV